MSELKSPREIAESLVSKVLTVNGVLRSAVLRSEIKAVVEEERSRVKKLEDALKPFANLYEHWLSINGDPMMVPSKENLKSAYEAILK